MNRNGTIQGALPIVARAVGRKLNVSVGIGGRNAFTDGTHIQLPALPLEAPDDELATVAFGFLEHEAAHVRYTDMESFAPESDVHKMFTNIFEDVRIEKALGEEYPGFAEDLRGLTEILVRDGEMGGAPDPDAPLATKMGEYALLRSRYEVLGPEALKEPAELAEKAFREAVPPGLATRVGAALGQVRDLASTQAASDLAKAIIRFVEQEQQEQSEAAGDGGANGGGGGETSDDASQEAAAQGSQNDGSEAAAMAEALKEMLESDGEDGPKGLGEAAAEALSEHAAQQPHDGAGSGATVGRASKPFVVTSDGAEEIDTVSGATLALRTRLRGLLASAKQNRRRTARRGKRLDRNRLVKAMAGNPKIFVHRTQGVAVNTAVQILLDRSGSMAGREVKLARESALACGLALAEIQGVNLSTAAFPGRRHDVIPITRFGESVRRTAGRYASVEAEGGTPMLEALLWGVDQLLSQSEPRRMCLIVTDGGPNDVLSTAQAIRQCWAGGIEVMGIGIGAGTHRMQNLFPVWAQVDTIDELAFAMFTMMREALTRKPS